MPHCGSSTVPWRSDYLPSIHIVIACFQDIFDQLSSDGMVMVDLNIPQHFRGAVHMSKEQKSNKESKKKPALTAKEKKAAKKDKKANKGHKGLMDWDERTYLIGSFFFDKIEWISFVVKKQYLSILRRRFFCKDAGDVLIFSLLFRRRILFWITGLLIEVDLDERLKTIYT